MKPSFKVVTLTPPCTCGLSSAKTVKEYQSYNTCDQDGMTMRVCNQSIEMEEGRGDIQRFVGDDKERAG
jgi:hypothetical protein